MTITTASPKAAKVAPGRPPAGYPIKPGQSGIARAAASRGNDPHAALAPPPGPRPRRVPLTPMRQQAARSMRKLAEGIQRDHPELAVHDHVRDAARTLESGNEEASQRHLRAAMFSLTPHSLMRNGVHDDEGHISARQAVHGVHRHLLLVKDIQDVAAKNQAAIRRDSYGDYESGPAVPRADPNAGYGPGALAQKPTARQPAGDQALNAPARTNSGGSDPAVADPVGPQPRGSKQFARTWDEVLGVLDLSAETGRLASTPAPYGKPGGPGLYGVKNNTHSPYFEQIVKGLMEKRGMDKGQASAIAWGALRKWSRGGGKVHSEVRAAASGALAGEKAAQARAHAHASTWDELGAAIDLAAAPRRGWDGVALELAAALPVRVPAGSAAGGQFGAAAGASQQPAAVGKAAQKAALLKMAAADRAKAKALIAQIAAAQAQIASLTAKAKTSTAKTAKATAATGKTASTSNVTKTTAPAAKTAVAKPATTAAKKPTKAQQVTTLQGQVAGWQGQVKTLLAQAAQATAQAAKL